LLNACAQIELLLSATESAGEACTKTLPTPVQPKVLVIETA
jgi:hypothetical protein